MAVYSLTSVVGAPGTTTTAVALALRWPRPVVLVDADPTAGKAIISGYLQTAPAHDRGLLELAAAARHGNPRPVLAGSLMQLPGSDQAQLLQGPRSRPQAGSLEAAWPALADMFVSLDQQGTDVIVDLGRIGMEHYAMPLLRVSEVVCLVMRSSAPAVTGSYVSANRLADELDAIGRRSRLRLAVVGQGQPYSAKEIAKTLQIPGPIPIAFDPVTADHFSLGAPLSRRLSLKGGLLKSIDAMISTLRDPKFAPALEVDDV